MDEELMLAIIKALGPGWQELFLPSIRDRMIESLAPAWDRMAQYKLLYFSMVERCQKYYELLMDVAESGVVYEARPPGLDWYSVQIDMSTWETLQQLKDADTPEEIAEIHATVEAMMPLQMEAWNRAGEQEDE